MCDDHIRLHRITDPATLIMKAELVAETQRLHRTGLGVKRIVAALKEAHPHEDGISAKAVREARDAPVLPWPGSLDIAHWHLPVHATVHGVNSAIHVCFTSTPSASRARLRAPSPATAAG